MHVPGYLPNIQGNEVWADRHAKDATTDLYYSIISTKQLFKY